MRVRACVRPPEDDTPLEIEIRSRVELQGVEQEYPAVRDQRKLTAPEETKDLGRSVGGETYLRYERTVLITTAVFQPHPQLSAAVRLMLPSSVHETNCFHA